MKDEFKAFVRSKPELIKYVDNGKETWQKIYEKWALYGSSNSIWDEYKKQDEKINLSSINDFIKKIDAEQIKKGVNSLQKVIELIQGLLIKDSSSNITNDLSKERQLFRKFED